MRYCRKCIMPDTRPHTKFNEEGICYPCLAGDRGRNTNWEERWNELEKLANKYRESNGNYYDCIIAASAGKDSYFQTHIIKEKLGMNPLLVMVDNFSWTETGKQNWNNLLEEFGVDAIKMCMSPKTCKKMFRMGLEKLGQPTWYFDRAIYSFPYQIAVKIGIPLVIYGEDTNYLYGGPHAEETPSAIKQITNDVAKQVSWDFWLDDELTLKDVNPAMYPTIEEMDKIKFNPIFLSYYVPWSGYRNMEFAKTRGFKDLNDTNEWNRKGFANRYNQIDTLGYLVTCWFKYPKFGHHALSQELSYEIREGLITRDEAVERVINEEYILDEKMLDDFLNYLDYDRDEFWRIVDKYANREILEKRNGTWRLKPNVEKALRLGGEVKE